MDELKLKYYLEELENSKLYQFRDWSFVPRICAGVYTIWRNQELIYVGVSGNQMTAESIQNLRNSKCKPKGLYTRLKDHASGKRSGDQFCIYVADKLVLPLLTAEQISAIANGELSFDSLIKTYIHNNFLFRFVETEDYVTAREIEDVIKGGALKSGSPQLNPANLIIV
jgi:hypothetical protein